MYATCAPESVRAFPPCGTEQWVGHCTVGRAHSSVRAGAGEPAQPHNAPCASYKKLPLGAGFRRIRQAFPVIHPVPMGDYVSERDCPPARLLFAVEAFYFRTAFFFAAAFFFAGAAFFIFAAFFGAASFRGPFLSVGGPTGGQSLLSLFIAFLTSWLARSSD